MNFYDAWWFLAEHPKFNHLKDGKPDVLPGFMDNLDVEVVRVDPMTLEYSKKPNAITRIWLEAGPWVFPEIMGEPTSPYAECRSRDERLNCGGTTYEEAIIKMADLVKEFYGSYEEEN